MIVGLQIFIEKEEMVLDSNFWCGCPENIQNQCFFYKIRDLFCFKQAEKVPKIPVYRLFTPGCERS